GVEQVLEPERAQPQPYLKSRRVRDHTQRDPAFRQLQQRHLRVRVEHQLGLARAAVGHDAGGEDLRVHLAELALQQLIEHALELEAALVVDGLDAAAQLFPGLVEAGIDHAVDGGLDRGLLHAHEVGERVVEIEDDRSDHARLSPGPWPVAPSWDNRWRESIPSVPAADGGRSRRRVRRTGVVPPWARVLSSSVAAEGPSSTGGPPAGVGTRRRPSLNV